MTDSRLNCCREVGDEMSGRQYGIDHVLRWLMLVTMMALLLAWFYKALTIKDGLMGFLGKADKGGTVEVEEYGSGQEDARDGLGGNAGSEEDARGGLGGNAGSEEDIRDGLGGNAGRAGNIRVEVEQGVRKWLVGKLAGWFYGISPAGKMSRAEESRGWLLRGSPLLAYLAEHTAPGPLTIDMDPSYSGYLENQRLLEESRYFFLYGDENSQAKQGDQLNGREEYDENITLREITRMTPAYRVINSRKVTGTAYMIEQLMDYDFLMSHFYSVHPSTTADREEMDAEKLLAKDLSIEKDGKKPQILIYHTHSQEEFSDYGPANPQATVVGIGNYLTELLTEKGYNVIHDTSPYDMMAGELDRNHAYNYALEGITKILNENPSIQVVLDVHRDGVSENLHMAATADGKQMAPIMFFNGMSQTPEGPIEYLPNPYKEDNLAFSLQMQLNAAAYYPGLTRKIYLKGLRYNLHVRPRSALIEVGAQTNTYEEARNSMEPLAELLDMVLSEP